jgi:glycosyltransferase involved in cell wall biosynthesis
LYIFPTFFASVSTTLNRTPRIALVHDWLTGMRGGEKCLEVLCELFPDAPIYTLLHMKGAMSPLIESREIHTSFIQHFPFVEQKYRTYLPLFPFAIQSFDFSQFDVLISMSHCVAKGAMPRPGALHLCYCFTPMRYVYEMYDEYFGKNQAGILTRTAMALLAPMLRLWDRSTASRVDHFVAISDHIRKRIARHYRRDAEIIFPPVDIERFRISERDDGYYLIVSALVPYKKVDLAINAFNNNGGRLVIVGRGPDEEKLRRLAHSNIEFVGWKDDSELAALYGGCTALVFPGEEDFGIVPLEAMASGKPVIAYGKGGALETVEDGISGVFFNEQTVTALEDAVHRAARIRFDPLRINSRAIQFSRSIFKKKLKAFIEEKVDQHAKRLHGGTPDT